VEHRLSIRAQLATDVILYCRALGIYILQGRSVDISCHGIFIAIARIVLPRYAPVDVMFPLESGKPSAAPRRIPAIVVRTNSEGVGLMFAEEVKSPKELFSFDQRDYPRNVS
jgi:hypothetical protein